MKSKRLLRGNQRALLLIGCASLLAILVVLPHISLPASARSQSQGLLPGDSDGDGLCSEVDALAALQMAAGLVAPDLALDVDSDGQVTEVDALTILQWAVAGRICAGGALAEKEGLDKEANGPADLPGSSSAVVQASVGGTLTTADGVSLQIPPGALPADTEITLIPVAVDGFGSDVIGAVRYEPDGLLLEQPAVVSFPLPDTWDGHDSVEVYSYQGRDPTAVEPDFQWATVSGAEGHYVAEAKLIHFSVNIAVPSRNCHAGVIKQILNRLLDRGCDIDRMLEEANKHYKGVSVHKEHDCATSNARDIQALLNLHFEVKVIANPGADVDPDMMAQILQWAGDGRMVVFAFSPSKWRAGQPPEYFWQDAKVNEYAHSAVLEFKDNVWQVRHTVYANPAIWGSKSSAKLRKMYGDKYGSEEVFYYTRFDELNQYRRLQKGVALEKFWGQQPGAFSSEKSNPYGLNLYHPVKPKHEKYEEGAHLVQEFCYWIVASQTPLLEEVRCVPYPAVLVYVEKPGGPQDSSGNPLCPKKQDKTGGQSRGTVPEGACDLGAGDIVYYNRDYGTYQCVRCVSVNGQPQLIPCPP